MVKIDQTITMQFSWLSSVHVKITKILLGLLRSIQLNICMHGIVQKYDDLRSLEVYNTVFSSLAESVLQLVV